MTKKHKKLVLSGTAFALLTGGAAGLEAANSPFMELGRSTSQPIGHYNYCKKNYGDCNIKSSDIQPMKLTKARWKELVQVNAFANYNIEPVTDIEYYGVDELWVEPQAGGRGDCEDYALLKRRMLMERGWSASALLITVVRQTNGEGHAILTARTSKGDFVLDNLDDRIKRWHKTDYVFLKRQSAKHSGRWEKIIDRGSLVGSVKQ